MVRITIGVPVYNGADLLDESLACLARQTFRDFKVLIFDNASSDATPEIAKAWAARDPRFEHVRQPRNVGGVANFRDSLLAADSPWFMWRADDDLSDDNYLEVLYGLATSSPRCKLAISSVINCDTEGNGRRIWTPPVIDDPTSMRGRLRAMLGCHPSAFYGLWSREAARQAFVPLIVGFPYAFASDHLALYGPLVDGAVRMTSQTHFIARVRRRAELAQRTRTPFAIMVEVRGAFRRELVRIRSERDLTAAQWIALKASEPLYLHRTLPSLMKVARTGLREALGIAGRRVVGRHFERNV
jgi:glycosyltransferase involved in cell wall biosynthesis